METKSKHKVVLIGDPMVGKTAILTRLVKNFFCDSKYTPTVGTNFAEWDAVPNDQQITLHIWDTAGTEQYRSLAPIFYQNAEAAIVCYSQDSHETEKSVVLWIRKFQEEVGNSALIAIAANQKDKKNDDQCESFAEKLSIENGYLYKETSAKTGEGITELFQEVAEQVAMNANPIKHLKVQPKIVPVEKNEQPKKLCC
ncbi:Ras-related protein Rab-5A [Tritrichomonas foetus]|uniref:Ras-related protein Rab-5A n=1 Tax=Tritrichomonas foetus TaxID=1144522 RepID=A0A1J4JSU6_9EUKA|nr:Ras-related protein Rab-5A [Tritrichomonas foetus]|eukprot:OHT01818.1 Ras-related protein Rab-5A [Tritrichomonas foetus]